jgi:hypothetical protein
MKRFWIIPAAIVLVIAIACFFVGWLQLSLSPDTYGVVFTKSHGFEKNVVDSRGITWRWERLIPGALTLYAFRLSARSVEIPVSGSLPSGDVYAQMAAEKPDFSFEMRLALSYRLRPEILPGLAETSRLRPDGLEDFYRTFVQEAASKASAIMLESPVSADQAERGAMEGLTERLETELPKSFAHIEFLSIQATSVRVPDIALYLKLRDTYLKVSDARQEVLRTTASKLAAQEAEQAAAEKRHERTIAILEKYGELLDKHPALIKLLFLSSSKNFSALDLQSLDIMGKLDELQ